MINLFTLTGNHFGITAVVFKCAVQIILAFWYLYNSSTLTIFWTVWKRSTTRRDLIWYVCLFCFRSLLSFCTVFYFFFFNVPCFLFYMWNVLCLFFYWTQFISDVFHFSPEYLLSYLGLQAVCDESLRLSTVYALLLYSDCMDTKTLRYDSLFM